MSRLALLIPCRNLASLRFAHVVLSDAVITASLASASSLTSVGSSSIYWIFLQKSFNTLIQPSLVKYFIYLYGWHDELEHDILTFVILLVWEAVHWNSNQSGKIGLDALLQCELHLQGERAYINLYQDYNIIQVKDWNSLRFDIINIYRLVVWNVLKVPVGFLSWYSCGVECPLILWGAHWDNSLHH